MLLRRVTYPCQEPQEGAAHFARSLCAAAL